MKVKKKICKQCKKKFKPYRTTQVVCSTKCAIKEAKKKKEKQQASLLSFEIEQKEQKKLSTELTSTRLMIHEYIRERDKGKPCISCGKKWNDTFQAGHFYKAELYSNLKFDLDNIHGQCFHCNNRLEGNLNGYAIYLPDRIGIKRFEALNQKAKEYNKKTFKWDRYELKKIRKKAYHLKKQLL